MLNSVTIRNSCATLALLLCAGAGDTFAQDARSRTTPLSIAEQGSFFVGGKLVYSPANFGQPDPTWIPGQIVINQMFVRYQVPAQRKYSLPVIMMHGGGHFGKTYETTPDGREGWGTYFVRKGFAAYVADDPNRAGSGYDVTSINLVRQGLAPLTDIPLISRYAAERAWLSFRFGPSYGVPYPDTRFPLQAAEQYYAQLIATYRNVEENDKIVAAVVALLDQIGPAILLTHSQSGPFGWRAAIERPNLVKGIVAVEPGLTIPAGGFAGVAKVPVIMIRGDHETAASIAASQTFVNSLRAAGGDATLLRLPELGIFGNTHMMMMDRNNLDIADLAIGWIEGHVQGVKGGGK
jgi:pimeloyl-ACP methyl ester carboxylesterase